ncbi:AAA family ATPase [Streptomyces pluripotens]|uniref:AAA family ATPase n=1 Tax=Streptomyces pluripotens TaxID=1355015 RepID=A0A221P3K4_9ACTN|nr:ATP-binding protein [Streptomyces pluripotens]ARP72389.1 AAA family ATPase [Streptomyces pluripotens]ASN26638.1 AAA family ATPase [Streptomyces pluripotens]
MDPNTPGPEEHGHASSRRPPRESLTSDFAPNMPVPARMARLVSGDLLLTVNPVDGSEIEPCPPVERPGSPRKRTAAERAERERGARPAVPPGPARPVLSLLERQDERERVVRLLARGRSVRLTGPGGSGRTALLDLVAEDCLDLAPDGVVRLNGFHRTADDLLYDLFHAVYEAPGYRPERGELLALLREIGAVVVLDDLELGGAALDELLDATPECAFLMGATPEVAAPSVGSEVEEVLLGGLDRTAGVEILERTVGRVLSEDEVNWAGDLWFESEGLPLRFVQAGALLRQRDQVRASTGAVDVYGVFEDMRRRTDDVSADVPVAPPLGDIPANVPVAPPMGDLPADGPADADGPVDDVPADAPVDDVPAYEPVDEVPVGIPVDLEEDVPLPSLGEAAAPAPLLASRLSASARAALRLAVALDGEVPHQAHLPALVGDTHADAALGELASCGLVSAVGSRYRLAAGVRAQLEAAGYADDVPDQARTAAQHYTWWAGHPSVTPDRVCAEADAVLAALAVLAPDTSPSAEGEANHAVRLARTAAPAFAAGLHWGAWERVLRSGAETSRSHGEVAEQAYFHHELGVLALCRGHLERARTELEASIGLRGALADKRGSVAGRRALALVADLAGEVPGVMWAAGEETPAIRYEESAPPLYGPVSLPPVTHQLPLVKERGSFHRLARRNLVAAGSGALLVAVLGTVVTLGMTSKEDAGKDPAGKVDVNPSVSQGVGDGVLGADPNRDSGDGKPPGTTGGPTSPGPRGTYRVTNAPVSPPDTARPSESVTPPGVGTQSSSASESPGSSGSSGSSAGTTSGASSSGASGASSGSTTDGSSSGATDGSTGDATGGSTGSSSPGSSTGGSTDASTGGGSGGTADGSTGGSTLGSAAGPTNSVSASESATGTPGTVM